MDTDDNKTRARQGRPRRGGSCSDRLDPAGPVLTSTQAAARLSLHPRTVMERARAGDLPGLKLGGDWRFATAALDAAVRGDSWAELDFQDETLTTYQVAALLGMGPDKVGRLARQSALPHWGEARRRRFSRAAILRTLCGPSTQPAGQHGEPPIKEDRTA
ncbi:helix-turn-helix domain-containing protein [Kitasatospora sp. NPDC057541]|uniref:helix-turn-helix domain-containing protein n=1 Tax=unclassified Kitasatospora TaxID=2633591 RepID=UPI0036CD6FDE